MPIHVRDIDGSSYKGKLGSFAFQDSPVGSEAWATPMLEDVSSLPEKSTSSYASLSVSQAEVETPGFNEDFPIGGPRTSQKPMKSYAFPA